eukprot:363637-Chlamydomonas_euryale.AAC.17
MLFLQLIRPALIPGQNASVKREAFIVWEVLAASLSSAGVIHRTSRYKLLLQPMQHTLLYDCDGEMHREAARTWVSIVDMLSSPGSYPGWVDGTDTGSKEQPSVGRAPSSICCATIFTKQQPCLLPPRLIVPDEAWHHLVLPFVSAALVPAQLSSSLGVDALPRERDVLKKMIQVRGGGWSSQWCSEGGEGSCRPQAQGTQLPGTPRTGPSGKGRYACTIDASGTMCEKMSLGCKQLI